MNTISQRGFTSLLTILLASLALGAGGTGAIYAFGRHEEKLQDEYTKMLGISGIGGVPHAFAESDEGAPTGSSGTSGATGTTGETGPTGFTGTSGITGPTGSSGVVTTISPTPTPSPKSGQDDDEDGENEQDNDTETEEDSSIHATGATGGQVVPFILREQNRRGGGDQG